MRADDLLGRYRLLDLVTSDSGTPGCADVLLWRGYDTVLDRTVAIRVLDSHDARVPAVVGAAQASALVDDRALLRVLDVMDVPATDDGPATVAVVSEWASGRNLERTLADRHGSPLSPAEAVSLVTDIARTLSVAQQAAVAHGRLRPSSVFITDAGEVRLRGLAVDAAVFGPLIASDATVPSDPFTSDVDGLGAILYALTTGAWPGAGALHTGTGDLPPSAQGETVLPPAPRQGETVLPPSRVRAMVPASVDDLVARSLLAANRPRGVTRLADASAFALAAGTTLDYLAPVSTTVRRPPATGWRRAARIGVVGGRRVLAVAVALALVCLAAWGGWQLITSSSISADKDKGPALADLLTAEARPIQTDAGGTIERIYPISAMRSYDPFGDDDGNDKPDKRKGREGEEAVATINDADAATAWLTDTYSSGDLDAKGGTGVVLDLGAPQDVREIAIRLVHGGGDVEVRAADRIMVDPALWTLVASVPNAPQKVTVRTPRPITARYLLIWLTALPPAPDAGWGLYQEGIKTVSVMG